MTKLDELLKVAIASGDVDGALELIKEEIAQALKKEPMVFTFDQFGPITLSTEEFAEDGRKLQPWERML